MQEPGLPFSFRGDTLVWTEDDKLLRWHEGAKDWQETPVGLRVLVKKEAPQRKKQRFNLLRDALLFALILSPFAALVAAVPKTFGTETLANVWFFASLALFSALGYWVIRGRS